MKDWLIRTIVKSVFIQVKVVGDDIYCQITLGGLKLVNVKFDVLKDGYQDQEINL